jgi:hypothetical protein
VHASFDEVAVSFIHNLVIDHFVTFEDLLKAIDTWQVTEPENERWAREMASFQVLMQKALVALDSLEPRHGAFRGNRHKKIGVSSVDIHGARRLRYPAISESEKISFNQLNRKTGHRHQIR